jgi:hypothetical protein
MKPGVCLSGCLLLVVWLIGCTTAAPPVASTLGPDTPPLSATATSDGKKELTNGVHWLWASVTRLQKGIEAIEAKAPAEAAALENALDQARADCFSADTATNGVDTGAAKSKWRMARSAIGDVAEALLPLAAKYGLTWLVAAINGGV